MKAFIEYLESAMPNTNHDKMRFQFQRDLLNTMNERYMEVSSRGIEDKKVILDLIISEHKDLESEYHQYYLEKTAASRRKRRLITNTVGSVAYILLLIIVFVAVGLQTDAWSKCWLIVVDGILLWVDYLLFLGMLGITKLKRVFHIFARILQAMAVVVLSVAVFLFCLVMVNMSASWVVVLAGIIAMFVADLALISVQKHKLAVVYYLIYIPVIATMLFIILAYLGYTTWTNGWIMIPAGIGIDIAIVIGELLETKHFEREMMKSWQEN